MLKYKINLKDTFTDNLRIDYSHFEVGDIDFIDENKTLVTCFYNDDIDIKVGDTIIAVFDDDRKEDGSNFVTMSSKIKECKIENVNSDERFFTIVSDKYCELSASYMSKEVLYENEDDIISTEVYEGKTEYEKSFYKPYEYTWKPEGIGDNPKVITTSEYETLTDYAKDSYYVCYKNTTEENLVIPFWVYESLDDEEKTNYELYAGHMVLSPYIKVFLTLEEYEQLFDYEKHQYQVTEYVYPNGKTEEKEYLYVWFNKKHFFSDNDFVEPSIFIECDDNEGNLVTVELSDGEIVNDLGLRFVRSEITDMVYDFITASQQYRKFVSYDENSDEIPVSQIPDEGYFIGRLDTTKVLRYDVVFPPNMASEDIGTILFLKKHLTGLNIPLQQVFSTDMHKDEIIKEKFIEAETKKAINDYVEMEKDVYHPVVLNGNKFENVKEIRFNLHFREHRGDDWIAEPDSFWNGTYINGNGKSVLMNYCNMENYGFFSYKGKANSKDKQSDNLSYLNFSNNDVKFQKNIIKKSFLRLSFYDSPRQTDQHLLQFSTIFMDSGRLFGKYTRNFLRNGVYSRLVLSSDEGETKIGLDGIRVDREPYITNITDDEIENYRLSSQFSVKDRYSSLASSDGFYLYLWKDNDLGFTPSDIYLKVEFNHAGYGRTIPFMMPYKDNRGIKSFQDILDDWNENGGYGIRKYIKYSYIHFKYKYDKETQRHIYYLDKDQYGNITLEKGNVLNINLWEAKVV